MGTPYDQRRGRCDLVAEFERRDLETFAIREDQPQLACTLGVDVASRVDEVPGMSPPDNSGKPLKRTEIGHDGHACFAHGEPCICGGQSKVTGGD